MCSQLERVVVRLVSLQLNKLFKRCAENLNFTVNPEVDFKKKSYLKIENKTQTHPSGRSQMLNIRLVFRDSSGSALSLLHRDRV